MEHGQALGFYTTFYVTVLTASLFGLPYLGLKAPRHYLVCFSTALLAFGLTRGHQHEDLRTWARA